MKPIVIKNNKVYANLDLSYSIASLSKFDVLYEHCHIQEHFYHPRGKIRRVKAGDRKNYHSSALIELRMEFVPYCGCKIDEQINPAVGMEEGSKSEQDIIYKWHFAHRHGFPTKLSGSGRGQSERFYDILNHPLSYLLMCNEHHELYDEETGEWKNPKNNKS